MNTLVRKADREITDISKINALLEKAKILHLGLVDGDFPYIVPLHYGFEYCDEKNRHVFYMHGAKEGHKIDLIETCAKACVEIETDVELISGGDIPCMYGSFYSSYIGRGEVSIVEDMEEKKHGLNLLMLAQTGRSFEFTEQMISSAAVIKVSVDSYTAKAKMK